MNNNIDLKRLAATTNFVHESLIKARVAEQKGDMLEAVEHYRSATFATCAAMTEEIKPHRDKLTDELCNAMDNFTETPTEEQLTEFFEAEESLLRNIGLNADLVSTIMGSCVDFVDNPSAAWERAEVSRALEAAEYHVCHSALTALNNKRATILSSRERQALGRKIFYTAGGVMVIGANVCVPDISGLVQSLSIRFGLRLLPKPKAG